MSDAGRYLWSSLVVDSDVPLPELQQVRRGREPDVIVRRMSSCARSCAAERCHEWRLPDGRLWASVARSPHHYLLRFQRFAEFSVARRGRSVGWRAPSAAEPSTIRHLLLDQVLPALVSRRSMVSLHASAVVVQGRTVAFAGATSHGKSTLAASFALAGHTILTDDCLVLRWQGPRLLAIPSYPSMRLWNDSLRRLFGRSTRPPRVAHYTPKFRLDVRAVPALRFRHRPAELSHLYILERGRGSARVEPLSPREAYIELFKLGFRLDPADRATLHREVVPLARIAARLHVARLRLPSRLDALGAVQQLVISDLDRR